MLKSKPQVVVITGASAGVGRATAREFARAGASIGLIARGREGLEATRKEIEELGGKALVLSLDVSQPERVEEAADQVERIFGPIDVWVNNAMVSVFSPVKEMLPEEYRRVTEVTYLGYVYGTLAALHRMLPRDRGVIIQVSSALGARSIPLQSSYCAAKHAVIGFTESLRTELIHDKSHVRVSLVHLPAVNTPQFGWVKSRLPRKPQPVPPIFQPEVPARAIFHASKHPVRDLQVGFPTVKAMVGEKIAPGALDHYLASSAYDSQQTDQPADPDRVDNLWKPVPGDPGCHGTFDSRAKRFSPQLFWAEHKPTILSTAVLALGLAAKSIRAADRRQSSKRSSRDSARRGSKTRRGARPASA